MHHDVVGVIEHKQPEWFELGWHAAWRRDTFIQTSSHGLDEGVFTGIVIEEPRRGTAALAVHVLIL